jgi:hypothetical protein
MARITISDDTAEIETDKGELVGFDPFGIESNYGVLQLDASAEDVVEFVDKAKAQGADPDAAEAAKELLREHHGLGGDV